MFAKHGNDVILGTSGWPHRSSSSDELTSQSCKFAEQVICCLTLDAILLIPIKNMVLMMIVLLW
jgi:hypothetical protein